LKFCLLVERARAKGWRALLHIPGGGGTLGGDGGSIGGGLGISAPLLGGGLGEAGALLSALKSPLLTGGGIITGLVGLVEGGGSLDGLLGLLSLLSIAADREEQDERLSLQRKWGWNGWEWELGVPVEEEIGHDVPTLLAGEGTLQVGHLAGKKPEHEADGVLGVVVARNGNVDVPEGRVGVGERDGGDVHIRGLSERLLVWKMALVKRWKEEEMIN
jgi:hypothetical protein